MSCVAKHPLRPRSPVMKKTAKAFLGLLAKRSPDKLEAFAPLLRKGFDTVAAFREGIEMFEDDEELLAGFKKFLARGVRPSVFLFDAALCRSTVSQHRSTTPYMRGTDTVHACRTRTLGSSVHART